MRIQQIAVTDEPTLLGWWQVTDRAERFGREATATPWNLSERRTMLANSDPRQWVGAYAGYDDADAIVVAGMLSTPLRDNPELAQLTVWTDPDHRRLGYGSAMLAQLTAEASARGRSLLLAESSWPLAAPYDGAGCAGADFLTRQGFVFCLGDVMRQLDLPVPDTVLGALAERAADRHGGYHVVGFTGPVPEEFAPGWAALDAVLATEAPMGALALEAQSPDVALLRAAEAEAAAMRRTQFRALAHRNGEVVAYSELIDGGHGRAYQHGTLVRRTDRGHALGLAVKVAALRELQASGCSATTAVTWNAEENSHMIAINEELGYRPVERLGEFQKRL